MSLAGSPRELFRADAPWEHGLVEAPALLSDRGLEPALLALAARTPLPVTCSIGLPERLPGPIEAAAYFMVVEALTNVVRHANANAAEIAVRRDGARVLIDVRDDGIGGADPSSGSGLRGLADRITALDGHLRVERAPRGGTLLRAHIPMTEHTLRSTSAPSNTE
jgi:signal transduction histidine kinase